MGILETAEDIRGAGLEYRTGGRVSKGSILRLKGQVNATIDFVQHPIDTVRQSINNHNEIVAALEAAGDFEGAIQERARFATIGVLSAGGGGLAGVALKNRLSRSNSLPVDPPVPNNDMTGIVMEGGDNNLTLSGFSNPNTPSKKYVATIRGGYSK